MKGWGNVGTDKKCLLTHFKKEKGKKNLDSVERLCLKNAVFPLETKTKKLFRYFFLKKRLDSKMDSRASF